MKMRQTYLILLVFFFTGMASVMAQETLTGTVTDADGLPLLGVNVVEKGTNNGNVTDFDGRFTLKVEQLPTTLFFSYVGFKTAEVTATNNAPIQITLEEDAQMIDEVVVTALNIERDKTSLGYSLDVVDSDQVTVAKENNIVNSLSGKVSGLQITTTTGGVNKESRVILRGISSLTGNNTPLLVVDGFPINGSFSDINPDDVESISVLKGAGASAAYGSRGANGVILVTTKKSAQKDKIGISVATSLGFEDIMLTPDLQNEYGTGAFNQFAPINSDGRPVLDYPYSWSWGPMMEGQTYTNWLGNEDTYTVQGNPFEEFYRTGVSAINTVTLEGAGDKSTMRFTYTDQRTKGIIPNNDLKKHTFNLRSTAKLTDKLAMDSRVTYILNTVRNSPRLAESGDNTALMLSLMPRDIKLSDLKANTEDANGNELKWLNDNTFNNPYWTLAHVNNQNKLDRLQGFLSLTYDISPAFTLTGKSGIDILGQDYTYHADSGSSVYSNGRGEYRHNTNETIEWNSDFLLSYKKALDRLNLGFSVGGNYLMRKSNALNTFGRNEKAPDLYRISNYGVVTTDDWESKKGIYSWYLLGQADYGGYAYLDATFRNDISSTLPKENRSYFYYSVNGSLLFSRFLGLEGSTFSSGKIRGSVATVGNDTDPYQLLTTYNFDNRTYLPYAMASSPSGLPNSDLKPENTESWEVGTDLAFFDNRLTLGGTYYESVTDNQIMPVTISRFSGYHTKRINAGSIKNSGFELAVNGTILQNEDFSWELGANITKNKSLVQSLHPDLENLVLGNLRTVTVEARPGSALGEIWGFDYLRDNFGRRLINDQGFAQKGERKKLGDINPDFYGGITTAFKYKNWSLRALVSYQKGGDFYTWGRGYRRFFGTDIQSLAGRADDAIIEEGINENTGFENTQPISPILKDFTNLFTNDISTELILDATNVKMREMVLAYEVPSSFLKNTGIDRVTLSAWGRNLFFIYNAAGDIDPESSYSSGSVGSGFEHSALPSTRTFGMDLKLDF